MAAQVLLQDQWLFCTSFSATNFVILVH